MDSLACTRVAVTKGRGFLKGDRFCDNSEVDVGDGNDMEMVEEEEKGKERWE